MVERVSITEAMSDEDWASSVLDKDHRLPYLLSGPPRWTSDPEYLGLLTTVMGLSEGSRIYIPKVLRRLTKHFIYFPHFHVQ